MESKVTPRPENTRDQIAGKRHLLFDEKTLNLLLYGTKESRLIDVNKLKRKAAEKDPEYSSSKKQKITADYEEPRLTNAIRSFPDEVQLCVSSIPGACYGVCAKEHIPLGTWIGPYEGRRLTPQRLPPDIDSAYLWEIFKDGKFSHYLDGSDEENSSWMRFIRCARHAKEQNLYAFQYCGNIFYRAFKEIPPGRELLVWYDDKYPQFFGIPLGMQDYEFFRDSVASSTSRGSPKVSSTSTQVSSSAQEPKKYGPTESRENPHTGNFRVPSLRAVQPRLAHPTCSVGSVGSTFDRGHFGPPGIRGGPRLAGTLLGESKSSAISLIPTSISDRQSLRTFTQRPLTNASNFHSSQTTSKDLTTNQQELKRLKSIAPEEHTSNKQLKRKAGITEREDSLPTNSRGLPQRASITPEVTPSQLVDNDPQISPRTSEAKAVKTGNTPERPMPALHAHLPQAPPLHRNSKQFYYEPVGIPTSGISLDEFGMWRCRQCSKTFTQRVSLQMHECSQPPEKPYQCGQCTLSFASPTDLRSHVDMHTSDKLYKCGYCSRAFSGATTLNNHIRTHTGEKPFNCEKCNKTFSQASHLARHQRMPGECV